ncbi:MAG: CotH kinase family protein [Bacteroidaceae bacterium]|nr:CotH kinase family protein [Bacteroidaceae bacterium]
MFACACVQVRADGLSFNPLTKFRIVAANTAGSSAAPGMLHGVNTPVCITTSDALAADCYWYIQEYKDGQYAIRNAQTHEYMTWDEVRSDNPLRRYMTMTTVMRGDSSLWTIRDLGDDLYTFESVASETHRFNVRSGTGVLGTYASSGTNPANNERFYIVRVDGLAYDPEEDANTICGQNEEGLYWTSYPLAQPVVLTTDMSNPVCYYIKNVRSQMYVDPMEWLSQSVEKPQKRFFFVKDGSGVQIMVEGGSYVSTKLTETTATSEYDVSVFDGEPDLDDEQWAIDYDDSTDKPGYSIGVLKGSANSDDNIHFLMGSIYWNDYSSRGIRWFRVDRGSTFAFYSTDERHREYLASQGLVIKGATTSPDTTVVPPGPIDPDVSDVEPIEGKVLHIYRADGRVEAVPRMYIDQLRQGTTMLRITTKDGGPVFEYAAYEVDSLSEVAPEMPIFNSFKFNNKFNHHIIEDAQGVFDEDSLITLSVVGIGKTLRPSFQLDDDVQAFIGDSLQQSKRTRVRFDKDVIYTVARRGYTILRRTIGGTYKVMPYGREVKVQVDFATDHSTGDYQVPTVYVTTDDGTPITSKSRYWDGKVRIDGAGVFPDLPETPMQIKGRGNSSWTTSGKAPYHMKFETALKVLGLKKGKHWNLIANAQNRSMTSNAVAMKMAQLVETAGFNHEIPVDLYVNDEYRGSYNLTEKVGLSNNSIDLADETYATLLELDSYYDETYRFRTTTYNLPINIKEPDLYEGTSSLTLTEIAQSFNPVWKALEAGEGFGDLLDLDYLARFLFVDELSENYELFHPKSTFCYNENIRDPNSKYIFGPVWDFDWGYGYQLNGNYFTDPSTNDFWTRVSMEASQWAYDLRYCGEDFDKIYYQLWHRFMTDGSLQELIDFCDDYYHFAAPSFTHDNTKWNRGNAQTYATVTSLAKDWLLKRANYVYSYMGDILGYKDLGYLDDIDSGELMGDVNDDGQVTTSDVVCVFNHILNLPNEEFKYGRADIDGNNIITIADLINVRNIALAQPVHSRSFYALPEAEAVILLGGDPSNSPKGEDTGAGSKSSPFRGIRGDLPLTINVEDGDYSGVQFDICVPIGMTLDNVDVSRALPDFDVSIAEVENTDKPQTSNLQPPTYRVSIYSSARNKLPLGKNELTLELGCDGDSQCPMPNAQCSISNVLFSTSLGEDERSRGTTIQLQSDTPTGIDNNEQRTENNGQSVYDIHGRKASGQSPIVNGQLPKGIYIIDRKKVVIK